MPTWRQALSRGVISGSVASLASTAALALLGKIENGDAAAPTNATSQWLWGDRATRVDGASLRHTAVGYVIHHAASIFWATLYEKYVAEPGLPGTAVTDASAQLPRASAVAALAYVVDFHLIPRRLTPGFERRLSPEALLGVYAAFALGLAAGATLTRRLQEPAAHDAHAWTRRTRLRRRPPA